jgi:UDP-2,3-diacylglucosamine hydrolase
VSAFSLSASRSPDGRLGILAGRGELPWIAARRALAAGEDVILFCFTDEAPPADLADRARRIILTRFYSSFLRSMRREGVTRLLLLGKATRDILYNRPSFDLRTLFLLARMASQSDYSLFEFLAKVVEKSGVEVIPQDRHLDALFLAPGRYGKALNTRELKDVVFGLFHAAEMNRLDVGQSVVVGKQAVLAVEAAEGTDRCIRRGGELFHKKGAVVCKLAKVDHDLRFDIPVAGETTLASMHESGCRALAFESDRTFVVHPTGFLKRARELGLTILVIERGQSSLAYLKKLNAREARPPRRV